MSVAVSAGKSLALGSCTSARSRLSIESGSAPLQTTVSRASGDIIEVSGLERFGILHLRGNMGRWEFMPSIKKADAAKHLKGVPPRRLTHKQAPRNRPGRPLSSRPTTHLLTQAGV